MSALFVKGYVPYMHAEDKPHSAHGGRRRVFARHAFAASTRPGAAAVPLCVNHDLSDRLADGTLTAFSDREDGLTFVVPVVDATAQERLEHAGRRGELHGVSMQWDPDVYPVSLAQEGFAIVTKAQLIEISVVLDDERPAFARSAFVQLLRDGQVIASSRLESAYV